MPDFHSAAQLAPADLSASTPLGYLRSLDLTSNATEFLIVEHQGTKAAVILAAKDHRWLFDALPLTDETNTAWHGVGLGEVEVVVDLSSGSFSPTPRFSVGCVTVCSGKVWLTARPGGRMTERVSLPIADAEAAGGGASATFDRWQLIQRDRKGEPVVLFDRAGPVDLA